MKNLSGNGNWNISDKTEIKEKRINHKLEPAENIFTHDPQISKDIVIIIKDLRNKLEQSYKARPIKETYDALSSIQDLEKCII